MSKSQTPAASDVEMRFMPPMLARATDTLPKEGKWSLEVKLDGIRALAIKNEAQTRLFSRRRNGLSKDFPEVARAVSGLPVQRLMVDGEIVALDTQGRSSFQLLQNAKRDRSARERIFYYMFDVLYWEDTDTTAWPLSQRRRLLQKLTPACGPLRFSESLPGAFGRVWKLVRKLGLEGIVAKREDSHYETGRRSGAWLKFKARNEQEFVIGGYTSPEGHREYFGAIVVGYYQGDTLLYAGRVGTGFDEAMLKSLYRQFGEIRADASPFSNLPAPRTARAGRGINARDMQCYTWLKPRLVCQVKFAEWTRDGSLRQPVFLGLREDKKPSGVVRET